MPLHLMCYYISWHLLHHHLQDGTFTWLPFLCAPFTHTPLQNVLFFYSLSTPKTSFWTIKMLKTRLWKWNELSWELLHELTSYCDKFRLGMDHTLGFLLHEKLFCIVESSIIHCFKLVRMFWSNHIFLFFPIGGELKL